MSNYIYYKVWDKITYPFPNFNCATVQDWEWISNFTHFIEHVITYAGIMGLKLNHIDKKEPQNYRRDKPHNGYII